MKKLVVMIMAVLFFMPVWANEVQKDGAADDQALVAASYQQGEDASDPAAPVTKPVQPPVPDAHQPAASAPAAAPAPAPEANSSTKLIDDLSQQVTGLHEHIAELQQQNEQIHQLVNHLQYGVYALAGLVVLLAVLGLGIRVFK